MSQEPVNRERSVTRTVVAVVLVAVAVVFIAQNTDSAPVHFLGWSFRLQTWVWILVIFVLGFLAGVLVPRYRARSAKKSR